MLLSRRKTFIFVEWEDARTGLPCGTAIAVTFDRDDDAPLVQKYQMQPNVNREYTGWTYAPR